jgi:Cof subfamily protein (haloacid dehalogenase superfamily)
VALDIDGTILDSRGDLPPDVRGAVRLLAGSGVDVVLATGRSPWGGIAELADELGLTGLQVTMQGALVSHPATGVIARLRPLQGATYLEALEFAAELGIDPVVGLVDGHRAERLADGVDFLAAHRVETRHFRHVSDLGRLAAAPPIRVFLPTPPGRHRAVREAAIARFAGRAAIVWSDGSGIEVLAPGTDKGEAVGWLAASRGIELDAVAAVGDAANDTGMLRRVGRSAAMGSAPLDVRAAADLVVPTSDEGGVIDALAWFFPDLAEGLKKVRRDAPSLRKPASRATQRPALT